MITPQDIKEKTFEKAVFGGYDMSSVDTYLEDLAKGYQSLYNEVNTQKKELTAHQNEVETLKSKMKVLVDKIEEYRRTEEDMSRALLSAQRAGSEIEDEAKRKSELMVEQAEAAAAELVSKAQLEVVTEEARLVEAKQRSVDFLEQMRSLCVKQLDFFDNLGDMQLGDLNEEAKRVSDAVQALNPVPAEEPARPAAQASQSPHPPQAPNTPKAAQNTGSVPKNKARQSTGPISQNTISNTAGFGTKSKIPNPNAQYGSTVSTIEDSLNMLSSDSDKGSGFNADIDTTRLFDISGQKPDLGSTTRSKFKFDELRFDENFDTKA